MKPRPIQELLQLMLDNFDEYFVTGLCGMIMNMYWESNNSAITKEEQEILFDYLTINAHRGLGDGSYWWKAGYAEPRIKYLKKHINLLSKSK